MDNVRKRRVFTVARVTQAGAASMTAANVQSQSSEGPVTLSVSTKSSISRLVIG